MQISMQNKKKQTIYIVIIVISLGVTVWLVFGSLIGGGPTADLNNDLDTAASSFLPGGTNAVGNENAAFPYGINLDFSLFSEEAFLELTEQPRLIVTEQEIGKVNAFVP